MTYQELNSLAQENNISFIDNFGKKLRGKEIFSKLIEIEAIPEQYSDNDFKDVQIGELGFYTTKDSEIEPSPNQTPSSSFIKDKNGKNLLEFIQRFFYSCFDAVLILDISNRTTKLASEYKVMELIQIQENQIENIAYHETLKTMVIRIN